jgi:hypothetical protein
VHFSSLPACQTHLILINLITLLLFGKEHNYKATHHTMFPVTCYFIPLSTKCSPQHSVLKHPQSMFIP